MSQWWSHYFQVGAFVTAMNHTCRTEDSTHTTLPDMDIPKDFFTQESILTFTGATGATFVICNGVQRAFGYNPKWLGLVIAICISILGVYNLDTSSTVDYVLAFINGFLIYCTAAGATEQLGQSANSGSAQPSSQASPPTTQSTPRPAEKRAFLSSWFR